LRRPNEISNMPERVRLEDVAKLAGVSTATVSRVLSRPDMVKETRRQTVHAAIDALGYVPDASARALASGRTFTIGCVVPFLDQAIFARSIQSLQSALLQRGYQLLIASHEYDPQREYEAVQALQQRAVDALVLVGTDHSAQTWGTLRQWGKPVLLTWSCDERLPSVGFDNHAVAVTLTEHLLALGHRKIGVISGYTAHNDRARARIAGVRHAMAQQGLKLATTCITEQSFNLSGGRLGLEKLMALKTRPTAILCGNDLLAVGALLQAQRMGIRVPDDLSICGIDNNELSSEINPRLTTVSLPTQALGQVTADQLMMALSGEPFALQCLLPFELLIRDSTSAPAAKPGKR
jgi:LacI family transcriptional regulator